ncbi:hypothetical protein E4U55_003858 [Claviceps digitariae]|nr:hypothetical protein E4U55_003858 [Claviceps digitariae]
MATREECITARLKHLEELQKAHPDVDLDDMIVALHRNIDFEFDVKETLGEDTWTQMNKAFHHKISDRSHPDALTGLAEARRYLEGHKDLEDRFDAIYKDVRLESVPANVPAFAPAPDPEAVAPDDITDKPSSN